MQGEHTKNKPAPPPGRPARPQRRNDMLLLAGVLVAALALWGVYALTQRTQGDVWVRVSVGGQVRYEAPLNEDATLSVDDNDRHNTVRIEGGRVWMAQADCPDGLCLAQSPLRAGYAGAPIVCLPNAVVVELVGNTTDEVDAVVR